MPDPDHRSGLFPALLKDWRHRRGLSQLDLALTADVSSRHVSFLETGRSRPSPEMVLRLAAALGVPLRQVNAMLRSVGHEPVYEDAEVALPATVVAALELAKAHHEPFPLFVLDRTYRVRDLNHAALALLGQIGGDAALGHVALGESVTGGAATGPAPRPVPNLALLTFDPDGAQPYLANFEQVGRQLLWRIQRELLADPDDDELRDLLDQLLAMPTVDPDWRHVDLVAPSEPAMVVHLRRGDLDLRFLAMVTALQAPQNVAVEHLRIESWFPYDQATDEACRAVGTA